MKLHALTALAVLLLQLTSSLGAGLAYGCRADQRMAANCSCCCHARRGRLPAVTRLSPRGCCSVSPLRTGQEPTLDARRPAASQPQLVALAQPVATALPDRLATRSRVPLIAASPPSRPIYLTVRRLLI